MRCPWRKWNATWPSVAQKPSRSLACCRGARGPPLLRLAGDEDQHEGSVAFRDALSAQDQRLSELHVEGSSLQKRSSLGLTFFDLLEPGELKILESQTFAHRIEFAELEIGAKCLTHLQVGQ